MSATAAPRNICAGPFGAVYDYYIERPRLAHAVLDLMWGVDPGVAGSADKLRAWLRECGLDDVRIDREDGLAVFSAIRAQ